MANSPALTAERPAARPTRHKNPIKRKQRLAAYLFLVPFFVVFLTMLVIPLVYSGYLSLFESKLIGGEVFAGLGNYARALTDPDFLGGLARVGLFFIIQVPIMLGLALFLALALDSARGRGSKAARLLIFMPYAVPAVVATLMWGYLYGPDFGPIAQISRAVGLGTPDFLSPESILGSMMNIVTWEFVGYNMIIMYAALRSEPSLLNAIAPAAISNSFTPNYYAYNLAFINQELNFAAAIAFLLGLVIAIVSYFVQLAGERRERVGLAERGALP